MVIELMVKMVFPRVITSIYTDTGVLDLMIRKIYLSIYYLKKIIIDDLN